MRRNLSSAMGVAGIFLVMTSVGVSAQSSPPPVACPASSSAQSSTGQAVAVSFVVPSVSTTAPLSVTCSPASGSAFSVGTTHVTCTATDSSNQSASCGFDVTVTNSAATTTLPLVQATNLQYVGAFRVPDLTGDSDYSNSSGSVLGFNPGNKSLFISSHHQMLGEISIPEPIAADTIDALPMAAAIQQFLDPTEGQIANLAGDGYSAGLASLGGVAVIGGRMVGTVYNYYDANNDQRAAHFTRSLNLSTPSFQGFWTVAQNNIMPGVGFVSRYLATLPAAWQGLLGGTMVTGNAAISIISRTSAGPAGFTMADNMLAPPTSAVVPSNAMVYYDGLHRTLGTYEQQDQYYGMTTAISGVIVPQGFRSALYLGFNGLGTACYGDPTANQSLAGTINPTDGEIYCYDPSTGTSKGPHAYPYRNQVWMYDLNDWVAVKNGQKNPWDLIPTVWGFTVPYVNAPDTAALIGGIAYDPATQRIYVAAMNQDTNHIDRFKPVIHVYQLR